MNIRVITAVLSFVSITAFFAAAPISSASKQTSVKDVSFSNSTGGIIDITSPQISNTLVISQVYGGGGNAGAPFTNDFIEIFNRGATTVNLNTLSVQYATAAGSFTAVTTLSGSLAPGRYYLIQESAGGTASAALPAPDATGTINLSATAGKVIIANQTTALGCGATGTSPNPCTAAQQSQIIDLIGYGTTANLFEGAAPAPAGSNTTADLRAGGGCADTDQNGTDFTTGAPNPRNTGSAANPCSSAAPPSFAINNVTLPEGNGDTTGFVFTVTKTGASASSSTVTFATANGTATAGSDYTAVSGTLTFAPGDTTMTITVPVTGDTSVEANETFTVTITAGTNATVSTATGTGTITNDDAAPAGTIEFSSATFTGGEAAGTATLTIRRTGGSSGAISASLTFTDGSAVSTGSCGAGQDYTSSPSTVSFANGDATDKTVTVAICNDTIAENAETFGATLSGASAGGQTTATVTIIDNDGGSPTVTLGNPSCQGLATPPLNAGTGNRALMCFSLSASNGADFTGLTVQFSSNPAEKYTNPKLFKSTDTDYNTKGDNVFVSNGTVDTTKFTFSGFTALNKSTLNKTAATELTDTPTIFFVVSDVLPTVNSSTPESTPTVSPSDIMTTPPTSVSGTTATSPAPITFAPAVTTAAAVDIGGRVTTAKGRGIFRAIVILTDGAGDIRQVYTNGFGYYRFSEVEVGQTLIVSVKSKGYRFSQPTQVVSLTEETGAVNFTAY